MFPWAGNSEEKEAPLGARCLPGVLDGTVLPPFSLLFFPLLSHTVFHRRSFPFFPSVPRAPACSYFYRPLCFSPSNAFPSRFDTRTRNPTARLVPSLLSRCCCAATFLSFSYSGSPSFLPPGRTAAGSAKRSLDGDKGPSYRS